MREWALFFRNPEARIRHYAADALGEIGPAAKAAVPALISALKDQDWEVRRATANALGKIGPAPKDAVPGLMVALKDPESVVRSSAAAALKEIALGAVESPPVAS